VLRVIFKRKRAGLFLDAFEKLALYGKERFACS